MSLLLLLSTSAILPAWRLSIRQTDAEEHAVGEVAGEYKTIIRNAINNNCNITFAILNS